MQGRQSRVGLRAVAWLVSCLGSLAPGATAQEVRLESALAELRETDAAEAPEEYVARALALLARLEQEAPQLEIELEVRANLGFALMGLERYAAAADQLQHGADLARALGDDARRIECLGNLAILLHHLGDFERGAEACREALQALENVDLPDMAWRIANTLGAIHIARGDFEPAIEAYSEALEILEGPANDLLGAADVLNNIGVAQMQLGEFDQALEFIGRARRIHQAHGIEPGLASTLSNLGDVHHLRGDHQQAITFHQEALRLREELGSEHEVARSHHSIGSILLALGDANGALRHLELALHVRQRLGLAPDEVATLTLMAEVFARLERGDEALKAAAEGLDLANALEMKGRRLGALDALAAAHAAAGELPEALQAQRRARELERELRSLETRREFAAFEAEFNADQTERRIALLQKDNELQALALEKQALQRNSLFVGSGLLLLAALLGWSRFLVKRRAHRELDDTHGRLRRASAESTARRAELEQALAEIKRLEGLLPICAQCKSIRDEHGEWQPLEGYLAGHAEVDFTHGLCPSCATEFRRDTTTAG